jgi:hypothetical protein
MTNDETIALRTSVMGGNGYADDYQVIGRDMIGSAKHESD